MYGAEADVLVRRFPPADYEDPGSWAAATRRHQAELLRIQVEALRIRKYRPTGGFALDRLLDPNEQIRMRDQLAKLPAAPGAAEIAAALNEWSRQPQSRSSKP